MPIITDRKVGFEFKNRNLEFLNQPVSFVSLFIKVAKQSENIVIDARFSKIQIDKQKNVAEISK